MDVSNRNPELYSIDNRVGVYVIVWYPFNCYGSTMLPLNPTLTRTCLRTTIGGGRRYQYEI